MLPLEGETIKKKPSIRFLLLTQQSNYMFHLLQNHFRTAILPGVAGDHEVRMRCVKFKNAVMASLEAKFGRGLELTLVGMIGWLARLLELEQKKTDFRVDEDDPTALTVMTTPACDAVCAALDDFMGTIKTCLDGDNLDDFLLEFGLRVHRLILEHMRKFVFTTLGGLLLTRDLTKYQNAVLRFGVDRGLHAKFEMLRELGNVFIVRPDNLKQVLTEGHLKELDKSFVTQYLHQRVDYQSDNLVRNLEHKFKMEMAQLKERTAANLKL